MRLLSLDIFRAVTIMLMVIADLDYLGEHVAPSIQLVDLIFPFFLFCVGFAIPYSHKNTKRKIFRALVLFAIGLFLNGFPMFDLNTIRIMGVLQRIAICYFICSIFVIRLTPSRKKLLLISLLVFYGLLLLVDSNMVSQFDLLLLHGHTYTPQGDPEGFFSTIGALCSTMFGLIMSENLAQNNKKWALFGAILIPSGLFLSFVLPISKDLWSPSYILYSSGFALLSFAILHYIIDFKGKLALPSRILGAPGANAILIYVVSNLLYHLNILNQSIVYVILYLGLWIVICNLIKIHIRI